VSDLRRGDGSCHWRFLDLEVWQAAADLAVEFHHVAQTLDERRLFRYADQLRAAGLSVANNIAEGSGSPHLAEFRQFLNIGRRSLFETASMVLVFQRLSLLTASDADRLLEKADKLSRQLYRLMNRQEEKRSDVGKR
jgi:four helix bundle protein